MSNITAGQQRCYLYNAAAPDTWGDCCDDLSIVPKPVWVVFVLTVPIEAVLAGADVRATAGMYEKKSNQTAVIFLLYNFVTLGLLAAQFDWSSCDPSLEGVWECYQGLLFMFYNSTAALASMTLWMLIIMRKYYPQMYLTTRVVIFPNVLWKWFDRLNLKNGGTHATVERWNRISSSTKLFWYNRVGIVTTLIFGGVTHIIPMFAAYPYILVTMCLAMVYSHSVRLGYTSLPNASNFKSTFLNVFCFYPMALVVSAVFLALSPLALLLKLCGVHPKDKEQLKAAILPESVDSSKSEVFFRTEGGVLMTLDVERTATVPATIALVKDNLGFDFVKRTIHLATKGNVLPEDNQSMLSQFLLESGAVLDILVEPERVEIRIRLENGDTIVVNINSEETVSMLMEKIAPQCGIPASNQWLLLDNSPILPSARLGELALLRQARLDMQVFELIITLNLQLPDGSATELSIRRDVSVSLLQEDIARQHQLEVSILELKVDGELLDQKTTLHAAGVTSGTVVSVLSDVNVTITLESGEDLTLRISAYSSIESLMLELEGLTNISRDSQFLLNNGQRVDTDPEAVLQDLESTSFELFPLDIEVKLRLSSGETQRLKVRRDMTSSELLETIAEIEEAEVDDLQLLLKATTLEVSEASLHSLGLGTNTALVVVRFLNLAVQLDDASQLAVRVKSGTTVRELKKQLQKSSQLPPGEQFLVPQGQVEPLVDTFQISEAQPFLLFPMKLSLRIQRSDGDTVELTFRRDDSGEALIAAAAKLERVEAKNVRLEVNSREIVPNENLFAQGVGNNDTVVTTCFVTLSVLFTDKEKEKELEVVVKRNATIADVKGALHEQLSELPIERMFLTQPGKQAGAVGDGKAAVEFEKTGLDLFDVEIEVTVKMNAESVFSATKVYKIRLRRDDKGKTLGNRLRKLVGNKSSSQYSLKLQLGKKELNDVQSLHAQGVRDGSEVFATFKKMTKAELDAVAGKHSLRRQLKKQESTFQKRIAFLRKKAEAEKVKAKEQLKAGNKKQALIHMKKAKIYEREVVKLESAILSMEEQLIAIESMQTSSDIVATQKREPRQMKKMFKKISIDKIESLQDDIEKESRDAEEVQKMLSTTEEDGYDDEELLKELDEFEVESAQETMLPTSTPKPGKGGAVMTQGEEEEQALLEELEKALEGSVPARIREEKVPEHRIEPTYDEETAKKPVIVTEKETGRIESHRESDAESYWSEDAVKEEEARVKTEAVLDEDEIEEKEEEGDEIEVEPLPKPPVGGEDEARAVLEREAREKRAEEAELVGDMQDEERAKAEDQPKALAQAEAEAEAAAVLAKKKEEARKRKAARAKRRKERRRRVMAYIKDVLRNLCMFDPNGKVIMFAAATTFLCFTLSANYGLILFSGAPYLEVMELDWNARSSMLWFECTATNFVNINAFGLVDFLGLAIGTIAALIEFVDFLVTI